MDPRKTQQSLPIVVGILIAPLLVVLLLLLLAIVALMALRGFVLSAAAWCCWCTRGRDVLFVTSDSPIWQDYIAEQILPKFAGRAVVLNWSQRRRWGLSLSVLLFRHYGGRHEFCPPAIVFRPFRRARCFRFYEPFRAWKHRNSAPLESLEQALYDALTRES